MIYQNPTVMREELQEDLHSSGCSVTKWTISNEMLRNGLESKKPKKTSLVLKRNSNARLKFLRQHKEKKNSFGERVLWTDEHKIELFGHNYWNHVWRKDGKAYSLKNTVPIVKFGSGSIMIRECFSAKGVGKISVIIFTNPSVLVLCDQSRPGFELVSPCPFPTTITITPQATFFNFFTHPSARTGYDTRSIF